MKARGYIKVLPDLRKTQDRFGTHFANTIV